MKSFALYILKFADAHCSFITNLRAIYANVGNAYMHCYELFNKFYGIIFNENISTILSLISIVMLSLSAYYAFLFLIGFIPKIIRHNIRQLTKTPYIGAISLYILEKNSLRSAALCKIKKLVLFICFKCGFVSHKRYKHIVLINKL